MRVSATSPRIGKNTFNAEGAELDVMGKWHGPQASPHIYLRWWNPTSGRVLQREPVPSAPGGRAPPRYSSFGLCRDRLSSFPHSESLRGLGSGCLRLCPPLRGSVAYPRKPRLGLAKRPMLGSTTGRSVSLTPNHVASVALYSSTLVVGIHRPRPVSSGPFSAKSGMRP